MLGGMLADLAAIDDILFVIRADGATSEIRSNGLGVCERGKYVNVGDNDGPCHMHISRELVRRAEFAVEQRPGRLSFSVRFYDEGGRRVLAAFFTGMYGDDGQLRPGRKRLFDDLRAKYGSAVAF